MIEKIEENETVRMRYCGLGLGGWVGGWGKEEYRPAGWICGGGGSSAFV